MNQMIIPTKNGPIVLRPRQVVKMEGAYFMIESVNEVRNGRQVRMYHMDDSEALKYYIPVAPSVAAVAPGTVPLTPPPAPIPSQVPPQAPTGEVPTGIVPAAPPAGAPTGVVPEALVPTAAGLGKPIQGLSDEEIQDGLAAGMYTQDDQGNVYKNPEYKEPKDRHYGEAANHKVNPGAADE